MIHAQPKKITDLRQKHTVVEHTWGAMLWGGAPRFSDRRPKKMPENNAFWAPADTHLRNFY